MAIDFRDAQTGVVVHHITMPDGYAGGLMFSPDRRLFATAFTTTDPSTGSSQRGVKLWDVETGALQQTLLGQELPIESLCFSPDGKILAATCGEVLRPGKILLWDTQTGAILHVLARNQSWAQSLAFAPDGKTLASAQIETHRPAQPNTDGSMRHQRTEVTGEEVVWDVATGKPMKILPRPGWIGSFAYGGQNGEAGLVWDLRTGLLAQRLSVPTSIGPTLAVAFAADSKTVATLGLSYDIAGEFPGELRLWNALTGQRLADLKTTRPQASRSTHAASLPSAAQTSAVPALWHAIAFAHDGRTLISGGVGSGERNDSGLEHGERGKEGLAWWSVPSGTLRLKPEADTGEVFAVATSPNGRLVAGSGRYETILWDTVTGAQIKRLPTLHRGGPAALPDREAEVRALAFSPDSRTLASGESHRVRLWDVAAGTEIGALEGHLALIHALAFSPDGTLLAGASADNTVLVWDLKTRQIRDVLDHERPVTSVAFSPNGRLLASGSAEGVVHFWNTRTGALVLTFRAFPAPDTQSPSAWITYTPEGYYEGSSDIQEYLRWQVGDDLLPAANFEARFHHPERIVTALKAP